MSSPTKELKAKRKHKKMKEGQARKRKLRSHGSTPVFPIHLSDEKNK
jgi:hypothetical protein